MQSSAQFADDCFGLFFCIGNATWDKMMFRIPVADAEYLLQLGALGVPADDEEAKMVVHGPADDDQAVVAAEAFKVRPPSLRLFTFGLPRLTTSFCLHIFKAAVAKAAVEEATARKAAADKKKTAEDAAARAAADKVAADKADEIAALERAIAENKAATDKARQEQDDKEIAEWLAREEAETIIKAAAEKAAADKVCNENDESERMT